jgi:peptidoglycan/LPS O-acetylase OafA/YrhL
VTASSQKKNGFRPDVEGLRAVAVGVVLLYHAGLPFARGGYVGVDVFFVISGFLITGLLLRELESTGTVSLARFYSRRAKRLLPLTVVVLATVVVLSWLMFSPVRRDSVSWDVVTAGLYVINWRLAGQAVDYFAVGLQTSPIQHFWTLAIEEQFYLVWPTLLLAVAWWCRRKNRSFRPALVVALAFVATSSFAYGVYLTGQTAGPAYFSTFARGWELALGGLLALVPASRLGLYRPAAVALAWLGIGAILWSTVRFGDDTLFPGTAALLPTLGAVAIIAAGFTTTSSGPARLLTLAPVRHVGRISYSWYLWHWPFLVFAGELWGGLSAAEGLVVAAASWVPAVLTHHWVEQPFLRSRELTLRPHKALGLGAACTTVSVALGLLLFSTTPVTPEAPVEEVAGAEAVRKGDPPQKSVEAIRPRPSRADDDRSQMHADGCLLGKPDVTSPECVYGNPSSKTTVVLFGDSHAMQYFPALEEIAQKRDWRLVGLTKSACPPAEVSVRDRRFKEGNPKCDAWREYAIERIIEEERPSMIVTSSLNTYRVVEDEKLLGRKASARALEEGYVSTLRKLRRTGAPVVVMKDGPRPHRDIPECVFRHLRDLDKCAIPRSKGFDYYPADERAARRVEGAHLIDPTPILCNEKTCPAVVGDVLVYRNGAHLTATYARTLAPWLGERLPRLPDSTK